MKILITGGCGFIGTNLVRALLNETPHQIFNLDKLTYAGNSQSLAEYSESANYKLFHVDIADPIRVHEIFAEVEPDAVIHLAAESHVDRSIDGPSAFIQTNVVGTFNLLDASLSHFKRLSPDRREQFRFLHVSTDEVYGSLGTTGKFSESSPYDPRSPYSATKAASDHLARAWTTTYGLPVIITNASNNFGPYQFPEKLLPLVIIKCLSEESLPIYGNGGNVRDWLYVSDHISALMTILQHGRPGETYNIGGSCERTNDELVRALCALMDEMSPSQSERPYADLITYVTDRPGHDFRYAIDAGKLRQELNWCPQHSLDESLRATISWYLDNESWWRAILEDRYQLERLGLPT